ncbi:MAG: UvrD-helicase domain-containing protein [Anaerolineales bacterium]|jgi:DNA helicase-2/ATP-dependent DNA helicase PcrA
MDFLEVLNSQQRQAVTTTPGPTLVLAGPGSGKTRVLTHRIAYLLAEKHVPSYEILAVTFTNKAAREMSLRLESLLEPAGLPALAGRDISLGTFHAFCAGLIRREADLLPVTREFVIFDDSDQESLIRQAIKDYNLDPKQIQPRRVHNAISQAKNELIGIDEFASNDYFSEVVLRIYERYQAALLLNNALDFDDLLFWVVRLLREHPELRSRYRTRYQHLLVDEFQDTNTAQYVLLKLLAGEQPDLFVVGDPDQSIYRWRGADYRNVHRFQKDYPASETILLEQNYRSTQTILDVAMAVIDKVPNRQRKELFTERGSGEKVVVHEAYDEYDEASYVVDTIALLTALEGVEPGDVAVMYRTNAQSRPLEEAFLSANLPYRLVGAQRFYGRREIKDIIGYLRVIHNPSDQVSLLRVLNTPSRGIGDKTVADLLTFAEQKQIEPAEVLLDLAAGASSRFAPAFDARARNALLNFAEPFARWLSFKDDSELVPLIDRVLDDTDYRAYIDDGSEEGAQRLENIEELRSAALDLQGIDLSAFLERVALVSDQDTLTDAQNAPTLLTLHAAKGLEFPVVMIIGMDEEMLPHRRSYDDAESMAEERRLFYVGVTRAEDRLFLVRAFRRRFAGSSDLTEPSRFLEDIPFELLEGDTPSSYNQDRSSYENDTTWEAQVEAPLQPSYQAGMRVRHETFGEGVVVAAEINFDDEEVTVEFEEHGVKHLVASLAGLEVLSG